MNIEWHNLLKDLNACSCKQLLDEKFKELLGFLQQYKYLTPGNIQIRKQIVFISELSISQ